MFHDRTPPRADAKVNCCRFAGVAQYQDLFPYMSQDWRRHFDKYEWMGSIDLTTNHIRVSDRFRHDPLQTYVPADDENAIDMVVPHQGLSVNGWSDSVAAGVYLSALNGYAMDNWASASSLVTIVANPFDPRSAAQEIRERAKSGQLGGVAVPLLPTMLGNSHWDPIYQACEELGLPVIVHFSGVEGSYAGAPPLSGAPHTNPLSRMILMPHLAESNVASLAFEGAFYRFPRLQFLFAGFGFKWVPSLMRRMDQEWRNFRSDMPWVKDKPSGKALTSIWVASHPVGEAVNPAQWIGEFSDVALDRIVFASHEPFDADSLARVEEVLGAAWVERLMRNGRSLLSQGARADA